MKIVVTGATGFIGRRLVESLLTSGHEVTALTRDTGRAREVLPVPCNVRAWDARTADPSLVRGADAIVHLAGAGIADRRWSQARKREILESRVASSKALVQAISALPAGSRPNSFVGASAVGYYGDRGDEALTEQSSPGEGFLAEVCKAWEDEVRRAEPLEVRTAIVRFGIVLGRGGGALEKMLPPFRLGLGGRLGRGRQWMSWIHIDDIVGLLAHAVENHAVRGTVNGVAPEPVTNADFTAALSAALRRPAWFPVPALAIKVALGEMSTLLLASQRVTSGAAACLGFEFRFPALDAALENLCSDLSHERSTEQWLPQPPQQVFPFFSDAYNLEKITPDFLGFKVSEVKPDRIGNGTVIDYRLSLHGIPMRWRSVIEDWTPDRRFVDRQLRGPYARWVHTHEFEPHNGGTLVRDRIRYALPLSPLSDLVAGGMVERDLDRIFAFRRRRLEDLLT